MSKQAQLIKNTIILVMGKISTQFVSFFLLPLYTSLLTTAEYGVVDLVATYIVLLVPIITIQMEMALFRYLIDYRNNEGEKSRIISNSFYIVGILSVFFTIIFLIIYFVFHIQYGIYLILMLLATIGSNILLQTSRGLGDNTGYSLACIVSGTINVLMNLFLLLYLKWGIYSIFIATIMSNFGIIIFLFFRNKIYKYLSISSIDKSTQKEIVKYSLPLVPTGLLWWIINASDRTLITLMIDVSANGIYSVSNKFSNIINSFYSIFNMSWTESVSLYINDSDNFLKSTFNSIFKTICSLCLLLLNVMFFIFPLLIESKFSSAYQYVPILIISTIFSMLSSNLSAIYIAKKRTKEIAISTIISSLINAFVNVLFIRKIGLYAAALSTLVAFAILFLFRYIDVQKYVDLRLDRKNILLFLILFITSYVVYLINQTYIYIVNLLMMLLILVLVNYNEIRMVIIKLKSIYHKIRKQDF